MTISGFDPTTHVRSMSRKGYAFKPRQCAHAGCHLLFVPKSAEQTECEQCMRTYKVKICKRPACGKEYMPTSNGQKYCPDCIPIADKERSLQYAAQKGGTKARNKPRDASVPDTASMPRALVTVAESPLIASARALMRSAQIKEVTLHTPGLEITFREVA